MREVVLTFLWHMHQPLYLDHFEGNYLLPWVRLHALKDYYGMPALLRDFPRVRATFNLVPSLLQQLVDYAAGTASERFQLVGFKPAADLTDDDRLYILQNFFMANRPTMIATLPRYDTLLEKRGASVEEGRLRRIARLFSVQDFLDLQALQKLAWLDWSYRQKDPRVGELVKKGKNFTEADKTALAAIEREILGKVLPEYRVAAERGQIELSTTPYYHPILPLLCDSSVARIANPRTKLLKDPFTHPEDAVHHLREAKRFFREIFGQDPIGLWPSEGSVSQESLSLVAAEGFTWAATDEEILERSLGGSLNRGADGSLGAPDVLYRPYRLDLGDRAIGLLFRDHVLSDLFGFTYSKVPPRQAVEDFMRRIARISREWKSPEIPVIPVILDGENAWEYYPGDGREFLARVYEHLEQSKWLRTMTVEEVFRELPARPMSAVTPGSWINHNFDIWIGHDEDRKAWELLARTRGLLERSDPEHKLTRAWEEIYIAEGSDWFWWYGGDHSSENDWEFDQLFRKHLINIYSLLGREAPPEFHVSIIAQRKKGLLPPVSPTRFITPKIDGRVTSYFEWLGAGQYRTPTAGSSMHKSRVLTQSIWYGFNLEELYVRVDTVSRAVTHLASGIEIALVFLSPAAHRVTCRFGGSLATLHRGESEVAPCKCSYAADNIVEISVPFAALQAHAGDRLEFYVAWQRDHEVFDAQPEGSSIVVTVPDASFEDQYWEV